MSARAAWAGAMASRSRRSRFEVLSRIPLDQSRRDDHQLTRPPGALHVLGWPQAGVRGTARRHMQNDMIKEFIAQKEGIRRRSGGAHRGGQIRVLSHPANSPGLVYGTTSARRVRRRTRSGHLTPPAVRVRAGVRRAGGPTWKTSRRGVVLLNQQRLRTARQAAGGAPHLGERYAERRREEGEAMRLRTPRRRRRSATASSPSQHRARGIQALAAVLEGRSRCNKTFDEVWLCHEEAVTVACAHSRSREETGCPLTMTARRLYFLERLTDQMEERRWATSGNRQMGGSSGRSPQGIRRWDRGLGYQVPDQDDRGQKAWSASTSTSERREDGEFSRSRGLERGRWRA